MMMQLTQKGIQHESMGFIQYKFANKWADSEVFKTFWKKFQKYD